MENKSITAREAEAKRIIDHVFSMEDIDPILFNSKTRKHEVVRQRQISIFLIHKFMGMASTHIGRLFQMDHSTVLYNIRIAENSIFSDKKFKISVEEAETELELRKKAPV